MPNKNPMAAFMLSFIPGLGHFYLRRYVRAFLYGGGFGFFMMLALFIIATGSSRDEGMIVLCLFIAFVFAVINMIDMVVHLIRRPEQGQLSNMAGGSIEVTNADASIAGAASSAERPDRFLTIFLTFIPGLGHFRLGLMQRGLVFLVGFFGMGAMIIFLVAISNSEGFLAFLLALPIIWIISLTDVIQQMNRLERGETLIDRSIFDDFQETREQGRKSKMLATLLSVFPGAGHMYLGLQKRGIQLMAAFLFAVYFLDALHLSLFLFVIPILWFYSFFDALQLASRQEREPLEDVPFVHWLIHRQKWVGIALLVLGAYYLFDQAIVSMLDRLFPNERITLWIGRYLQPVIVSMLLIAGGLKLIRGQKTKQGEKKL
jgi:hypothetical protein